MKKYLPGVIAAMLIMLPRFASAAYLDAETGEVSGDIIENEISFVLEEADYIAENDDSFNYSIRLLGADDDMEVDEDEYYGRSTLSKEENGEALVILYDAMDEEFENGDGIGNFTGMFKTIGALNEFISENFQRVAMAYQNDRPEFFWLDEYSNYKMKYSQSNNKIMLELDFKVDGAEMSQEKRKEIKNKQSQIEQIAEKNNRSLRAK